MEATRESPLGETDSFTASWLRWVPVGAAIVVLAIGLTVLGLGWVADRRVFREVFVGWASMKVNTSIGFIFGSIALACAWRYQSVWDRISVRIIGLCLIALGSSALAADMLGIALPLENIIPDPNPRAQPFPGRMSPGTAIGFLLAGGAFVAYRGPQRSTSKATVASSGLVVMVGIIGLAGYTYGAPALYEVNLFVSMAVHTSIAFLFLGIGLITLRPWSGLVALLIAPGLVGRMVRRVLPATVLAPLFLGWLVLQGVAAGFYPPRFGFVLTALVSAGSLLLVVAHTGGVLREAEIARQSIQKRLHEHREWLWTTLHSIADGVLVTDEVGVIKLANPAAGKLLGMPAEELEGQYVDHFFQVFCGSSDERAVIPVHTAIATGKPAFLTDDAELLTQQGTRLPIADACAPLLDAEQNVEGTVLVFRDISREREAARQLQDAAEHKDHFIAMLGHELRNPLAVISNATALLDLVAPKEDENIRVPLELMDRQTRHMSDIVDDLLDVSRTTRGKLRIKRRDLDLREVIQACVDDYRPAAEEKGLTLQLEQIRKPLWAYADPVRMHQVLGNLVRNAINFTDRPGRIVLAAERRGDTARITVQDTGIGLNPDSIPAMFEPFHQAPQEIDRSRGGLGLGLSLVKGLVTAHEGTIEAISPGIGLGTTMIVTLPLMAPRQTQPDASPPAETKTRKVLLIEDDVDVAQKIESLLEREGHQVTHVQDGEEGVALVPKFEPDVVLCDTGLPGTMSGFDVARTLRERAIDVPCIALTGYSTPDVQKNANDAGFDELIIKPVDRKTLASLLNGRFHASRPGK